MSPLESTVREVVDRTPVFDIHTHLYPPAFDMTLWGADEILTYHYLVAETMRFAAITPAQFFARSKPEQADLVWESLFFRNSPLSEATAGVVTIFEAFGLDPRAADLREAREFFARQDRLEHVGRVMELAGVDTIVMTNDPLDEVEAPHWQSGAAVDSRFLSVLRLDPILNTWDAGAVALRARGYAATSTDHAGSQAEVRRFLEDWVRLMKPRYMAVSLPPNFAYPEVSARNTILSQCVLPVCREQGLPFAMMIGVRKRVHPALGDAGDSVGLADMGVVEQICHDFPDNRFLVTVLARENQHGLCVAARKFSNLLPFGCWWFMNNPSLVEETTRMRLEMLGTSFVPQHSDARVLEHLIYKWHHSRASIATALTSRYAAVGKSWTPTVQEIERDARLLLHDNAAAWVAG